jgi:hypothetical protein
MGKNDVRNYPELLLDRRPHRADAGSLHLITGVRSLLKTETRGSLRRVPLYRKWSQEIPGLLDA